MHRVSYNETGNVGKFDFDSSVSLYERRMKMTSNWRMEMLDDTKEKAKSSSETRSTCSNN